MIKFFSKIINTAVLFYYFLCEFFIVKWRIFICNSIYVLIDVRCPFRGGPLHYADAVGLDHVLARINEFGERFGKDNWTPAPLLEQLVRDGRSLAEWAKQNTP